MQDLDIESIEAVSADQAYLNSAKLLLEQVSNFEDPDSVGVGFGDEGVSITLGQIKEAIDCFIGFASCRLGDLEAGINE